MTPLTEARSVCVRIGTKALLDDVSLSVAPGEAVALVGPNGAGKSTLLRTLSGETTASGGTIRLKGRDLHDYPARELASHRAMLSQSTTVPFPFTVAEVVRMGAGERHGAAVHAMVDAALDEVGLMDFRDRIIGTLSGGEQQRAHFARVQVQLACGEQTHGPGLLLLDEPTASLDLRHQLDVVAAAHRCTSRGVAVVAILHDLNLAALFADRVIVLSGGRIDSEGAPAEVISDDMVGRVFGVCSAVGRVPPGTMPFVLPHAARKAGDYALTSRN